MIAYPLNLLLAGFVFFGVRLVANVLLDALFPWCDHPAECFDYAFELGSTMDVNREPCDSLYDHTCAFWKLNHPGFENQFALVGKKVRVQLYRYLEAASLAQSPSSIRDKTVAAFRKCQEVLAGRTEHLHVIGDVFKRLSFEWPSLKLPQNFDALDAIVALSLDYGLGYVFTIEPMPYLKTDSRYALVLGTRASPFGNSALNPAIIKRCVEVAMPKDSEISASMVARRIFSGITQILVVKVLAERTRRLLHHYVKFERIGNLTSPTLNASQWLTAINNHLDDDRQVDLDEDVLLVDASLPLILKDALRQEATTVDLMLAVGWAIVEKLSFGTSYSQIDCSFRSDVLSASAGCLGLVNELLPFPLARFVFDDIQPAGATNATSKMMSKIREATKKSFEVTSWMDLYTAKGARERVETVVDVVNLPDHLSTWENLDVAYEFVSPFNGTSFVEGYLETRRNALQARKRLLVNGTGVPVRREAIAISMIDTNAYYLPMLHLMIIPGGILFPPFVVESAPAAVDYGGIGRVLGHELTHAFDRLYSHVSRTGEVHDWYSNNSWRAFENKLQCVEDKVSKATGSESWAKSSLSEAFADSAGVEKAYLVYERLASKGAGMLGYSPEQLFFISGCLIFCGKERVGVSVTRIYTPVYLRCDLPAANLDHFAEAFHCRREAPLNPRNRCDFH
ncbi:membrane metallo-endopeptidase-like 1 [Ixodes scapularis]